MRDSQKCTIFILAMLFLYKLMNVEKDCTLLMQAYVFHQAMKEHGQHIYNNCSPWVHRILLIHS